MSTCTVNSPKKSQSKGKTAKWDDEKTQFLLQLFEAEINCGNRPSGVYSKQAWINIVSKFNAKTGLKYNKEQIKNKQDNLRREFAKWEALIGKETGLGWDNEKKTLSAPDSWWLEKAQSDPSILKYRESGPLHLDLLQKVFGGITANGFFAYIPTLEDNFADQDYNFEGFGDESNPEAIAEDFNETPENVQATAEEVIRTPNTRKDGSRLKTRKRPRDANGSRICQSEQISQTVGSLTETIREQSEMFKQARPSEDTLSYTSAINLLKGLPGFGFDHDLFWKAMRVLEDNTRRVAFKNILDGGTKAVCRWLNTFPDI